MDQERIEKHTALVEREDELLEQIDTCQQLLAATWRFLRSSGEPIHLPTVRRLMIALYAVERSIEDELLDIRLELLPFANSRKAAPSAEKQSIRVDADVCVDVGVNTNADADAAVAREYPKE